MSIKDQVEGMREMYQQEAEGIDEAVELYTTVLDQMLDKHGDKINALVSKMIVPSVVKTLEDIKDSNVSRHSATITCDFIKQLDLDLRTAGYCESERVKLICAALSSRK